MRNALAVVALAVVALASPVAVAEEAAPMDVVGEVVEAPPPAAPAAPRTADELIGDLASPLPAERVAAVQALAELGDPRAAAPIAALLRADSSVLVRGWAVRALAQLGTPAATEALAEAALSDPDQRVRSLAARLAGLSPETARPAPPPPPAEAARREVPVGPAPRPRPTDDSRLRVAGWVTFAASYGIALIVGTILLPFEGDEREHGWKLLLPVVGPGLAAATAPIEEDWERQEWAPASIFLWIFTGIQATGIILLSVGYAIQARERAAGDDAEDDEPRRRRASPGVVLGAGPGGLPGLSLAGWF